MSLTGEHHIFSLIQAIEEKTTEKILNRIVEYDKLINNFIGWPGLRKEYVDHWLWRF